MPRVVESSDTINAKEGVVYMTINGTVHEFAELLRIEARVDYIKADVKGVGKRMKGSKVVGAEGTGSMEFHYHRPEIRQMALEFVRSGHNPVFDVQVVNADITSRAGKQTALIKQVIPDGALIASLDGDSDDILKEETDFTFEDFNFLNQFRTIND